MKNQKILIINGHPTEGSLNEALCNEYAAGAKNSGAEVKMITIAKLNFDPNLSGGYNHRKELEPDLSVAWQKILWAEHLVWVHPVWWGSMPAIMKGFIDRVFLPGMAFKYRENSVWWDKLLTGKSAHIITTLHQPSWYYRIMYARPSINALRKSTLNFCGISPVKVTTIPLTRDTSQEKIKKHIDKIYKLGEKRL